MGSVLSQGTACAVGSVGIALVGSVLAASATGGAHASLTATLVGYPAGSFETVGFSSGLSWDSSAAMSLYSVRAQQHLFQESGGSMFRSWCIEVYQGVTQGSTYDFNVVTDVNAPGGAVAPGPMGAVKAAVARDLFARWIDESTGMVNGGMADRDAKSAAFQIALWEITHENFTASSAAGILGQMSLGSGAFRASIDGATAMWYDQIVQSLGVGGFLNADLEGLTSATAQDQLRLVAVPGPGAFALLALAGVFSRRRRRA